MGVCGNCSYPYEKMLINPSLTMEEVCGDWGCTHEEAVYKAQYAYDRLNDRYVALTEKYNLLKAEAEELRCKVQMMEDDCK